MISGPALIKLAAEAGVSPSTAKRRARGKRVNSYSEQRLGDASQRLGMPLPPVASGPAPHHP